MRQKRPEKLNEQEVAAWDSYDQQYDRYERIADALQPPKDYGIYPAKWRECLIELLASYGCDWLSWMLDRYGNLVGESITSAIEKSAADLARVTAERETETTTLRLCVENLFIHVMRNSKNLPDHAVRIATMAGCDPEVIRTEAAARAASDQPAGSGG